MPGFTSDRLTWQAAKHTGRLELFQRADFRIHGPTGTARFHDRPAPVQPDVANLRFAGRRAVINVPIHHQAAAYAAAEGDVTDRVETYPCPVRRFAQSAH